MIKLKRAKGRQHGQHVYSRDRNVILEIGNRVVFKKL